MAQQSSQQWLLSPDDAAPVEVYNAATDSNVLLVCEHAGQATPARLGTLGVAPDDFHSHIGWDIGAEGVARRISDQIGAPLVIQRYSRLVIDCNRPPQTTGSIPKVTGGISVPGNLDLSVNERVARQREIFEPYDTEITRMLRQRRFAAVFSIHSFTPDFPGETRPWDLGLLSRNDIGTAEAIANVVAQECPELCVALNQPYQIDDETDWLIPRHAEANGLRHALIEIRNSHILDASGQDHWAKLLSDAIRKVMDTGK